MLTEDERRETRARLVRRFGCALEAVTDDLAFGFIDEAVNNLLAGLGVHVDAADAASAMPSDAG